MANYIWVKSIWKDLLIPLVVDKIFWDWRMWRHEQNGEICFISAKMGLYTNLRDPILTIYTIFRNFRTGRIRWNTSFYKFPTSKISFCKGPPLQIWLSQKWPLFSKTEITNIFVLMDFYSPWVIEQENPNIIDRWLVFYVNLKLISAWGCFIRIKLFSVFLSSSQVTKKT